VIKHNIFTKGRKRAPWGSRNLWNTTEFKASKKGTLPIPYEYNIDYNIYAFKKGEKFLKKHQKNGVELNAIATTEQIFVDVENKDYRVVPNSIALKAGFVPFDVSMDSFGVTKDYPERLRKLDRRTTQWGKPTLLHGGRTSPKANLH